MLNRRSQKHMNMQDMSQRKNKNQREVEVRTDQEKVSANS